MRPSGEISFCEIQETENLGMRWALEFCVHHVYKAQIQECSQSVGLGETQCAQNVKAAFLYLPPFGRYLTVK